MDLKFDTVKIVTGEEQANKGLKDGWIYLGAVGDAHVVRFIFGIPKEKKPSIFDVLEKPPIP